MKYSKQERVKLANMVCELYEAGDLTLDSCCRAVSINPNTFYQWACPSVDDFELLDDSKRNELLRRGFIQEVHERFKKARELNDINYKKLVKNQSRVGLLKLLTGEYYEESQTSEKFDLNGDVISKLVKTISKYRAPDVTAIIFALKNVDKDNFSDQVDIMTKSQDSLWKELNKMTDEELENELQRLSQLLEG